MCLPHTWITIIKEDESSINPTTEIESDEEFQEEFTLDQNPTLNIIELERVTKNFLRFVRESNRPGIFKNTEDTFEVLLSDISRTQMELNSQTLQG